MKEVFKKLFFSFGNFGSFSFYFKSRRRLRLCSNTRKKLNRLAVADKQIRRTKCANKRQNECIKCISWIIYAPFKRKSEIKSA